MNTPAERADAFLHGLLSPADAARFEHQCAEEPELRAALDTARRRLAMLESALPPCEANELLVQTTLERIARDDQRRRRWRTRIYAAVMFPAAAAALIIGLFHVRYETLSANPVSLEVYGQNSLVPGSDGALRVRLWDKKSQQPVANVPVEITLGEPGSAQFISLASFNTDANGNGQPAFRLPDWADGFYPLRVTAQTRGRPEVLTNSIRLKRSNKLMLTTDKPIYQPGQTIHIRALTLQRQNLKPVADSEAVFTISDPRGTVIFRKSERTSKFGICAADCELADEILHGAYKIHVRVGDTESTLTVDVRKYVLPKIRLTIATEQAWYQPGQEVRGSLQANYHHGEPVADGEWNLEANGQSFGEQLLAKLSGRTDQEGRAAFSFRLPQGPLGERFSLTAQVRDRAGQEQSRKLERAVAAKAFTLTVIPESGTLVRGVANNLYVYVQSPDGSPVRVKGTYSVSETDVPFETSELGIARFSLTPLQAEMESVHFQLTDAKGNRFDQRLPLPVGQAFSDFLVRTDKAVYDGGDTMHVTALGGGSQPVFVDFLKDDQSIRCEVIDMKGGRGQLAFDVPPELFGTLRLIAYRFDAVGSVLRKARVLYVRPARQLQIDAKRDKPEHKPGETAKVNFQLTDGKGRPVPGALSLAMVDEAVFDVLQQMPGLERTFFLLEPELLKPVGTIYPWSPDEVESAQRQQLEQALFARTAQTISVPSPAPFPGQSRAAPVAYSTYYGPSPYSFTGSTYPQKVSETETRRNDGLHRIRISWIALAFLVAVGIYGILWMNVRWIYMVVLHAIGLVCACGLLIVFGVLFAFLGARSSAKFSNVALNTAAADGQNRSGTFMDVAKPPPSKMADGGPPPGVAEHPAPQIRVREQLPETMLWQPQLITDDAGHASLEVSLADSITTWRLSASAVSADGRLGALQTGIRAFQPFFVELTLPVTLTRNDEIDIPAVVSSFLPNPQSVELSLEKSPWFELTGADSKKLELKPREVRAVSFRLKAKLAGKHELKVTARSAEFGDAVRRHVEVVPDGRRVERIVNGELSRPAEVSLDLPAEAIEGSGKAIVRIYPSSFSQLVEGLDGIFRLPTGCFEQTSSSLYPNVMALSYLRRANKNMPEVEVKARQYIHVGYQRLLGFEVSGGGFDWYGRAPANIGLTAYGLMEFRDMVRVHDVDPKLIERTRGWLMSKRNADGSWPDDRRYSPPEANGRLRATAYAAWAVFEDAPSQESSLTREFLLNHVPETIADPYVLGLVCHGLMAIDPKDEAVRPYLDRLESLKQSSEDSRKTWWSLQAGSATQFYGSGQSGDVESTALAALALMKAQRNPASVRGALSWLAEKRQVGHWGSTQATILALKALMEGTGASNGDGRRNIEIAIDNQVIDRLDLPPDQNDVMKQIDLSGKLKSGSQKLSLRETTGSGPGFQVEFRYHLPGSDAPPAIQLLAIDLRYDRETLKVGQSLTANATVTNGLPVTAPMVMLDLPIPPGFSVETEDFDRLVSMKSIDRYQITPRQVIVYLRGLEPGKPLILRYRLNAGLPATVAVPAARVYEYYNPANQGRSTPTRLKVAAP